jgi:8-oxo-dGTP diphosphatase
VKILLAIILNIIAILIAMILYPICGIYSVFSMAWNKCDVATWYLYYYHTAIGFDESGNTVASRLFNDILIYKDKGYHFGMPGETISSALGKNVERGTLRPLGNLLNALLNKIQKNHSILSINNNINNLN